MTNKHTNMKKYIIICIGILIIGISCKKSILNLANPNDPTPSSLLTEAGIESFAMGVVEKWIANVPGEGSTNIFSIVLSMHSNMGDEDFSPWANWGLRYPANVNAITLPAPYNTVIPNPSGFTQLGVMENENSRQAGEGNAYQYEWAVCYYMNSQCNLLLQAVNASGLQLSGDTTIKKGLLRAWAYWWKGFAYSRIGSMYLAGIINDQPANGETNGNFVANDTILAEATLCFNTAKSILQTISETADYDYVFENIVPSFNLNTQIITPPMWIRQIYTYEARNYLVNHKVATMTATDWSTVVNLADSGMVQGDYSFMWGMNAGGVNDLSGNFYHPFAFHSFGNGFAWVSERLIQDYQPGDLRFTKNFEPYPGGPVVNVRNRGIQFGTRWNVIDIEDGGAYATDNSIGAISIGGTWEENALMIAEYKIRSGTDINGGLTIVDQIRDAQGSGLAHVSGTGLSQDSAISQFRSERRVSLYLRGLAFYDARRWGVTAPAASGGGRALANVLVPGSLIGSASATILPCFIDYDYQDYWDIPQNELDFNAALSGSAPIHN
jgi:hypothetical protein